MKAFVVFLFALFVSNVNAETLGDWTINTSVAGVDIANTSNGEGATTGVICPKTGSQCGAYIWWKNTCEEGSKYPMMINSSIGAFLINTTCTKLGEMKVYFIDESNNAKAAYESGGEIGFAIPLANGMFRSIRFSTKGATLAIRSILSSPATPPVAPSTKTPTVF